MAAGLYAEKPSEEIAAEIAGQLQLFEGYGLVERRAKLQEEAFVRNVPFMIQVEQTEVGYEARVMRSTGSSFERVLTVEAPGLGVKQTLEELLRRIEDLVSCYEQWNGFLNHYKANPGALNPFAL